MSLKKMLDSDLIRIEASLSEERVSLFKYYKQDGTLTQLSRLQKNVL